MRLKTNLLKKENKDNENARCRVKHLAKFLLKSSFCGNKKEISNRIKAHIKQRKNTRETLDLTSNDKTLNEMVQKVVLLRRCIEKEIKKESSVENKIVKWYRKWTEGRQHRTEERNDLEASGSNEGSHFQEENKSEEASGSNEGRQHRTEERNDLEASGSNEGSQYLQDLKASGSNEDVPIAMNKERPLPHKNEHNNNATQPHPSMMLSEYCRDPMMNASKSLSKKEPIMDDIICDLILSDRNIQPGRRMGKLNMDIKRFCAVNEAHCETVAQLVSSRLRGESDGPVTIYMSDQFEKSPVEKKMKLALAQTCLDSFIFPCAEKAEINCDKDFQQFLRCRIFVSSNPVRDIFGVRYRAEDISRIDLVLLIPPGYVGLFRHRDLCFLETLSNLLDSRKQRMLILRHDQLCTAGC